MFCIICGKWVVVVVVVVSTTDLIDDDAMILIDSMRFDSFNSITV
jgi:hypothetical protein